MRENIACFALFALFCSALSENRTEIDDSLVAKQPNTSDFQFSDLKLIHDPELFRIVQSLEKSGYTERAKDATLNDFIDAFLDNLKDYMIRHSYDPTKMPDIHQLFENQLVWITYHGHVDLTEGWLYHLSTMTRTGNASAIYHNRTFIISLPLGFEKLQFNYNYSAKIMDLGPMGGIDGGVERMSMSSILKVDLRNFEISLVRFKVTDTGHISFKFTGNALTDWLLNIITTIVTSVLHGSIIDMVSDKIGGEMKKFVDGINNSIQTALQAKQSS